MKGDQYIKGKKLCYVCAGRNDDVGQSSLSYKFINMVPKGLQLIFMPLNFISASLCNHNSYSSEHILRVFSWLNPNQRGLLRG